MGEPDALSRCTDLGPSGRDNQGIVLLDPSVFRIHALQADLVRGAEQDIVREIRGKSGNGWNDGGTGHTDCSGSPGGSREGTSEALRVE